MYTVVYNPVQDVVYQNTLSAGTGISIVDSVINNTGVLSIIAGTNVAVSSATGNVTVSVTGTVASATSAVNLSGGTTGAVPYQSSANNTTFLSLGTTGYVMTAGASAPQYVAPSTLSVGTATVGTTATINAVGTNATFYPTFVNAKTGNLALDVDTNGYLNYNPSTGTLSATTFNGALTGATTGSTLLAGNGSGGLANVTIGSGLSLSAGTLSVTSAGGSVTSVSVVSNDGISGTVANATTTPAITLSVATQPTLDISANAATTQFVNTAVLEAVKAVPFSGVTGGTYNFASNGSGCIVVGTASGGAVTGITTIAIAGTGYLVGDILNLTATGSNFDCYLRVTSVSSGGVTALQILYGGTGYTSGSGLTTSAGFTLRIAAIATIAGTLTSNATFIIPAGTYLLQARRFTVCNNTTGAFTCSVFLSNGSGGTIGTGVSIPQGTNNSQATLIFTDGVNDFWDAVSSSGSVSTVSVVNANGFTGTVATATSTPAITLETTITGVLKGSSNALVAATAGTDYSVGTSSLATGILKSTTSSGALTIAVAADFPTLNQSTTGNAATVTTNANLTGPITSVGNATSIASQTGTGTTFVMSNSPTLSTPNLGTPSVINLTNATGAPTWNQSTTGNAATATSISGGTAGQIPYQSSGSTTAFTSNLIYSSSATSLTVPYHVANGAITGSLSAGAYSYGTLGYSDVNIFASYQSSVNTYNQLVISNTNSGAAASVDHIVSNNLGTSTTYYGDFGMNSSGWAGSGSFNLANMVYLTATTGDLAIGTTTANAIHFVINGGTSDAMTISTGSTVSIAAQAAAESFSIPNGTERGDIIASAPASTTNIYANLGSVQYYTSNAANNFIANIAWSSGTTFNSATSTGDINTYVVLVTQSTTAYYCTSVEIDGTVTGVTTKWQGGTAPAAGNASGIDAYSFTVIKTASATYTVLASLTQF